MPQGGPETVSISRLGLPAALLPEAEALVLPPPEVLGSVRFMSFATCRTPCRARMCDSWSRFPDTATP